MKETKKMKEDRMERKERRKKKKEEEEEGSPTRLRAATSLDMTMNQTNGKVENEDYFS
jgi:hypothetical protein